MLEELGPRPIEETQWWKDVAQTTTPLSVFLVITCLHMYIIQTVPRCRNLQPPTLNQD